MKMKHLILIALICSVHLVQAQENKKVRVKITNEGSVLLDTSFVTNDARDIERLLAQYSDRQVYLNSGNIHSLYVFDITGHEKTSQHYRDVEVDLDEIFEDFGHRLEQAWEEFDMDEFVDTASVRAKKLHENMREYKATVDPELQELKQELKRAVDKMRATRIIIIEDGDTIRIPKEK